MDIASPFEQGLDIFFTTETAYKLLRHIGLKRLLKYLCSR